MLKMGAQNITGLYVGETKIKKAYLGEALIFSAGMNPSRLPEGYTEVKYIQIGENFEIDTGIKADFTNMRFVLSEEILSESRTNRFFQCTPEGGKYFECYHSPTVQNTRLIYSFATSTGWYISLDDPNDIYIDAQSPVFPRLKRSRCRSSQEVNDSPTPFSALNYC